MGEKYNLYINQGTDSDDEQNSEELISMNEVIEWCRDRLSDYVEDVKANDGFRGTMTRVTKKFVQLVHTLVMMPSPHKPDTFHRATQSTWISESTFSDLQLTQIPTLMDAATVLHGEDLLSIAHCALNTNMSSRTRLGFMRLCSGEKTFSCVIIMIFIVLFRVETMKSQGLGTSNEMFIVNLNRRDDEPARDRDRRVFGEYLRRDLGEQTYARYLVLD